MHLDTLPAIRYILRYIEILPIRCITINLCSQFDAIFWRFNPAQCDIMQYNVIRSDSTRYKGFILTCIMQISQTFTKSTLKAIYCFTVLWVSLTGCNAIQHENPNSRLPTDATIQCIIDFQTSMYRCILNETMRYDMHKLISIND